MAKDISQDGSFFMGIGKTKGAQSGAPFTFWLSFMA
jgi:hypothetical protein